MSLYMPRIFPNARISTRIDHHIGDLHKLRRLFDSYGAWGFGMRVGAQIEQMQELRDFYEKHSDAAVKDLLRKKLEETSITSVAGQLFADVLQLAESGQPLFASLHEIAESIASERKRRSAIFFSKQAAEVEAREKAEAIELAARREAERRSTLERLGIADLVDRLRGAG